MIEDAADLVKQLTSDFQGVRGPSRASAICFSDVQMDCLVHTEAMECPQSRSITCFHDV